MKGSLKKLRIFVGSFLLVLISCTISLVIGEIYLRLFKPQSIIPRYVENAPYGIRKNIGNVRGKIITPLYTHKFTTNSQGFRGGREYSLKKPPETYRIIVLGDSVTVGHGVEDEETFSAVLEKRLSQVKPTEVINMGVAGFGTAEQLIQLRAIGFKYNPDLVILAYFPNDPFSNIVTKLFKIENGKLVRDNKTFVPATYIRDSLYVIPGYNFLCQHSHTVNFIRRRFSSYFMNKMSKKNNIPIVASVLNKEQANITPLLVNEIIAETVKNNKLLLILNIPVFYSEKKLGIKKVINNFPKHLIKFRNNTYYIDVLKDFYADWSPEEISHRCYHPKPFGHKLIGSCLESFIKEEIWDKD